MYVEVFGFITLSLRSIDGQRIVRSRPPTVIIEPITKYYKIILTVFDGGTRWRSWLTHCATSRKVVGSIPDGVIDIILPVALWPLGRLSL